MVTPTCTFVTLLIIVVVLSTKLLSHLSSFRWQKTYSNVCVGTARGQLRHKGI